MARLTREQFFENLQSLVGDATDENTLKVVEDFSDTYNELEEASTTTINWKEKYEQNNANWSKKYKDRFFSGPDESQHEKFTNHVEEEKPITINDLFIERR